jgi:membrane protein YqaA with SNARE-associated domain
VLRRLYDWVLHWAETPYSDWALFLLAFAEASFFPIPPDVLLIALAVARPGKAFTYAWICALGSLLGGCVGYLIGYGFMTGVGQRIVDWYGFTDQMAYIGSLYQQYDAWAVGIAGFTPIPTRCSPLPPACSESISACSHWRRWCPARPVFSWWPA